MRSEMETLANNFDAELVGMIKRAKHMAYAVVPAAGPEPDDWLKVRKLLIEARNLIQRTRYRDDRALQLTAADYDRMDRLLSGQAQ